MAEAPPVKRRSWEKGAARTTAGAKGSAHLKPLHQSGEAAFRERQHALYAEVVQREQACAHVQRHARAHAPVTRQNGVRAGSWPLAGSAPLLRVRVLAALACDALALTPAKQVPLRAVPRAAAYPFFRPGAASVW